MLPRQAIEAQGFFDVFLHPGTEFRVAFAPFQEPGGQVLPPSCTASGSTSGMARRSPS